MQCLTVDELVLADEKGLSDLELSEFYEIYIHNQMRRNRPILGPRAWMRHTRGPARKLLRKILGDNFRTLSRRGRSNPIYIKIQDNPRPSTITDQRLRDLIQVTQQYSSKLWERLSRVLNRSEDVFLILKKTGRISLGYLNTLKGNISEIFSMPYQLSILWMYKYRWGHPGAILITGIQVRVLENGRLSGRRLFSDNIIAKWRNDGGLEILTVFEVKSGYRGGGGATEQVFEWIERRIDDGLQLIIPRNSAFYNFTGNANTFRLVPGQFARQFQYIYDPSRRLTGPRVIRLVSGDRHIITAQGSSQIGVDPSFSTTSRTTRTEMRFTSKEFDYLVRELLQDADRLPTSVPQITAAQRTSSPPRNRRQRQRRSGS